MMIKIKSDVKTCLYETMKILSIQSNHKGLLEMKKIDLVNQLPLKYSKQKLINAFEDLENEQKIFVISVGHIAKPYIWEIRELNIQAQKDVEYDPFEIIEIQHSTIKELRQKYKMCNQTISILEARNLSLNQQLEQCKYQLAHKE